MPEREVAVCSADEGQQARNSCPELRIFFSWHHMLYCSWKKRDILLERINGRLTEVNEPAAPSARASRSMRCTVASMRLGGPTTWSSLLPDTAVSERSGSLAVFFCFSVSPPLFRGCVGRAGVEPNEAAPPPRGKHP